MQTHDAGSGLLGRVVIVHHPGWMLLQELWPCDAPSTDQSHLPSTSHSPFLPPHAPPTSLHSQQSTPSVSQVTPHAHAGMHSAGRVSFDSDLPPVVCRERPASTYRPVDSVMPAAVSHQPATPSVPSVLSQTLSFSTTATPAASRAASGSHLPAGTPLQAETPEASEAPLESRAALPSLNRPDAEFHQCLRQGLAAAPQVWIAPDPHLTGSQSVASQLHDGADSSCNTQHATAQAPLLSRAGALRASRQIVASKSGG